MWFRTNNLRFVDSLQFFQSSLADLSGTYGVDTVKGYFPHEFNTRENQNYIGEMPNMEMFGITNMSNDTYQDLKNGMILLTMNNITSSMN